MPEHREGEEQGSIIPATPLVSYLHSAQDHTTSNMLHRFIAKWCIHPCIDWFRVMYGNKNKTRFGPNMHFWYTLFFPEVDVWSRRVSAHDIRYRKWQAASHSYRSVSIFWSCLLWIPCFNPRNTYYKHRMKLQGRGGAGDRHRTYVRLR